MAKNNYSLNSLSTDIGPSKLRLFGIIFIFLLATGLATVLYKYWAEITNTLFLVFAVVAATGVGFFTVAALFGIMTSFTSRHQEYSTSPGALFITRAIVAIPVGVLAGIFTFALIIKPSTTASSVNPALEASSPAIKGDAITDSGRAVQTENTASNASKNSYNTDDSTTQVNSAIQSSTNAQSQPTEKSISTKITYSDEEISRMEDEKQYHGNDPVVRKRLGLPLRDADKKNIQAN